MFTQRYAWRNLAAAGALLSSGTVEAGVPQAGIGIFFNMGGKSSWGIEAYGNYYPSFNNFPPPFFGGNIQIHFKKEQKSTF